MIDMAKQDWLVTAQGNCLGFDSPREWDLLSEINPYRFYRFLGELEEIIHQSEISRKAEEALLHSLRSLVRKLILNIYWITTQIPDVTSEEGTAFLLLYNEPGFPLTIQTEVMLPGTSTSIHNHGTWGIVAILGGKQKHTFWKRSPTPEFPDKIEQVGEQFFHQGDIISLTTDAIHCVEAVENKPTVTLNLYGETIAKRFNFDPLTHQAKKF